MRLKKLILSDKKSLGKELAVDVTETADFLQPTIMCLPGLGGAEEEISIKQTAQIDRLLGTAGVEKDKFQIIGIQHDDVDWDELSKEIDVFNKMKDGHYSVPVLARYREFAEKYFIPLLASGNPPKRCSLQEARKHFRNLNIVSYSHGSVAAQYLALALGNSMPALGYSAEEIRDVTSQVLHVSFGNVADVRGNMTGFRNYHIINLNDGNAQLDTKDLMLTLKKHARRQREEAKTDSREMSVVVLSPFHCFIGARQPNKKISLTSKSGDFVREDLYSKDSSPRSLVPKTLFPHDGHNIHNYLMYGIGHRDASEQQGEETIQGQHGFMLPLVARTLIANGLNNSIKNSREDTFIPLPSTEKLLRQHGKADEFTLADEEKLGMFAVPYRLGSAIHYNGRMRALLNPLQR